jgi:hypothetical protein
MGALMLAARDSRSENVCVLQVIVAELELGNMEVQVLFADLVEGPDQPRFDEGPEAFNRPAAENSLRPPLWTGSGPSQIPL